MNLDQSESSSLGRTSTIEYESYYMTYHSISISSYSRTFPCCKHLSQGIWAAPPQLMHLKILSNKLSRVHPCPSNSNRYWNLRFTSTTTTNRTCFDNTSLDTLRTRCAINVDVVFFGFFISAKTLEAWYPVGSMTTPFSVQVDPIPVRLFFTTPSPLQFQQSLWPAPPQFTQGIRQTPSHLSHPIIFEVPGNSIRFRIGFGGKGGGGFAGTNQIEGFSSFTSKSGFSKSFIALWRV